MKSNGGVLSAAEVVDQPITTVLSGPAAGALGPRWSRERAGFDCVVTLDGGGTSTDVTVVVDGAPALTTEGSVGAYPSKIPMIDVVTVGAGGGSIAWTGAEGTLKVGPHPPVPTRGRCATAPAERSRRSPTRTGSQPDPRRTCWAVRSRWTQMPPRAGLAELSKRLGIGLERCAVGILEISAWNQANALRQVTVKRGLDIRDFTLVSFGGSGSLLACRLVDVLGLRSALVPTNPGNLSAYGLLTVDVRNDYVRTAVEPALEVGHRRSEHALPTGSQAEADAALAREGFRPSGPAVSPHRRPAVLRPGL